MIVALARKLIIALWRYANDGLIPEGFRLWRDNQDGNPFSSRLSRYIRLHSAA
jgi:hypothetical protein